MARDIPARPLSQRARVIPTKYLRAECETLVRTVRHLGLATDAEIDAYRPGGAENPGKDAFGWLAFYRRLHRLHARVESPGGAATAGPQASPVDEEIVLGALREDPVAVTLVAPPEGGPTQLVVRVLSEHALRHLDARDDLLNCLARHAQALQASHNPEEHALRLQLMEEITYQQQVCAWICTSEAWPRLPFDPRITPRPEVPADYSALHPLDTVRIQAAHHRLNAVALTVTRRMVSIADDGNRGGSWRTFFSTLEREANGTIPAREFMRDRPLVSLLASRIIAADAERAAYEEAKEKAEREAKQR